MNDSKISYNKETLKNGLRVLTLPSDDVESFTTMVFVGAGSRYESKKDSGISHFLEHMVFKGTKKRGSSKEISEIVDAVGGEFNAGTSKEYTVYYIRAAKEHLEMSFDILSDMLQSPLHRHQEVENEKGVIVEEWKMYEDMPMRNIDDYFEEGYYGDTPLGRRTIGSPESINSVSKESIEAYQKQWYRGKNIILGVAGNIDNDNVYTLAKKYFSSFSSDQLEKSFEPFEKQRKSLVIDIHTKPIAQAHMILGFPGVHRGHDDEYALRILSVLLGGHMSSRLFLEIREKRKLCYFVRSSITSYDDVGAFEIQSGVHVEKISDALEGILTEVRKIKKDGITQDELQKSKDYIKGKLVLGLEGTEGLIEWYGMQELLRKEIRSPQDIKDRIDAVTMDDLNRVITDVFDESQAHLTLITPEGSISESDLTKEFAR